MLFNLGYGFAASAGTKSQTRVSAERVPPGLWDGTSQASRQLPAAPWLVTAPLPSCQGLVPVRACVQSRPFRKDTGRDPRGPGGLVLTCPSCGGRGTHTARPATRLTLPLSCSGVSAPLKTMPEVPRGLLGAGHAGVGPPVPSDSVTRPEENRRLRCLAGSFRGDHPARWLRKYGETKAGPGSYMSLP